ncbi:MAG: apolipoprotein N-acyltransferase [Pseudazoarcus pumilus]|nr:apolipoprotein N-acyltransferase [Pseudazoarcus pumilus]
MTASGVRGSKAVLLALLAGGLSVFAFAPFGMFPVAWLTLFALAWLLNRTARPRDGFLLGFAWGFGAFLAGISWLFVALNRYGGMPVPLAALAIALFCAYLALYPAFAAALFVRLRSGGVVLQAALFAALWVAAEGLRGWVFTGFPWLSIGYSQTPPSPLAGWLPVLGVYGVGGLLAFVAALAAFAPWRRLREVLPAAALLGVLMVAGLTLGRVTWTQPDGEPVRVALVQTNIAQELKWRPEHVRDWLELNLNLSDVPDADLVVLPESTLPMLADNLPAGYVETLASRAAAYDADLLFGVFLRDAQGRVFNATASLGASPAQSYAKRHLVPFGEYSPPLFGWFYELASIPMSDQTPGPAGQPPLQLAGQRIAINICYEDLFGRELLYALPEASLMLNVSNLAWYGHSFAQPQHLQIARVRALETGRPMLRATNTGMTAVVQPDGTVTHALPQFERGVLRAEVRGHVGLTPYARWGDWLTFALAALGLALALRVRRRG